MSQMHFDLTGDDGKGPMHPPAPQHPQQHTHQLPQRHTQQHQQQQHQQQHQQQQQQQHQQQQQVAQLSSTTTGSKKDSFIQEPSDEAVLNYLRQRGMGKAVMQLTQILKSQSSNESASSSTPTTLRDKMAKEESESRVQRSLLAQSTGGGYGYDHDAGPSIPQWGMPDPHVDPKLYEHKTMGQDEAKSLVDAFVAVQTWVLSLPDDLINARNPKHKKLQELMSKSGRTGVTLSSFIDHRKQQQKQQHENNSIPESVKKDIQALEQHMARDEDNYYKSLPPSAKPELLAVCFALLVHTHCELLEVGMESTAASLLSTFRCLYEPTYDKELADLDKCKTTEDMVKLNAHNSQHLDALSKLKNITLRVGDCQVKKDELVNHEANNANANFVMAKKRKIAEYDQHIRVLQQKYEEVAKQATAAFHKTQDFPFLRRARAVRWQLHLSACAYALLASYLSSREALLPMNTLLLKQCEVHVERRDPLPYIPACVLEDNSVPIRKRFRYEGDIYWAAPVTKEVRKAGGDEGDDQQKLPFPPLHLEEEYETARDADRAKRKVEFNRNLLINGFRRLEALERKLEYDSGLRNEAKEDGNDSGDDDKKERDSVVNPLEPSILLATLCSSASPGPHLAVGKSVEASSIWEESGVGLTCAKMSPPDGRRVAAGCDDAAVRIWSIFGNNQADEQVHEANIVLLGHKNGFPVFDVDWNRDGRTLLSAGGDGSIRLWDTIAKGTFGTVANVTRRSTVPQKTEITEEGPGITVPGLKDESTHEISGAALAVYRGHAPSCPIWSVAFAPSGYYFCSAASDGTGRIFTTDRPAPVRILSGHTSASVNSVAWHPNCNYVLTGCDDKTVRMWDVQTGRCVRLLNGCGDGINVVRVSPSGKYCAASDYSGVVHYWDLSTSKKVNEFHNSPPDQWMGSSMIHTMSFSACGTSLAVGGDDCAVRLWDVRGAANHSANPAFAKQQGTDSGVGAVIPNLPDPAKRPGTMKPHKTFSTRRTILLDLKYTKRNLLLSVGKYTTPVPLVAPIAD